MTKDKFDGYIPTPLRRRLGLPAPASRVTSELFDRIDSSGGNAACWPWVGPLDRDGYGVVTRSGRAHRLAWAQYNGRKLGSAEVLRHTCDNPCCCNPGHLLLGTQLENVKDRVERQRSARGAMNGRSKLSAAQVQDIFAGIDSVNEAARKYGLDESTVRGIRTGKTWAWLTSDIPKNKP